MCWNCTSTLLYTHEFVVDRGSSTNTTLHKTRLSTAYKHNAIFRKRSQISFLSLFPQTGAHPLPDLRTSICFVRFIETDQILFESYNVARRCPSLFPRHDSREMFGKTSSLKAHTGAASVGKRRRDCIVLEWKCVWLDRGFGTSDSDLLSRSDIAFSCCKISCYLEKIRACIEKLHSCAFTARTLTHHLNLSAPISSLLAPAQHALSRFQAEQYLSRRR